MTTVLRTPNDQILVLTKGADSVIFPLCHNYQQEVCDATKSYLDEYAKNGLRTLVLAQKIITNDQYYEWEQIHRRATLTLKNKEEELEKAAANLEIDFEISGSTAIEDRLQEGVPEAILHIRKAGIKLWILTGDKIETAVNIGYSCGLLDAKLN